MAGISLAVLPNQEPCLVALYHQKFWRQGKTSCLDLHIHSYMKNPGRKLTSIDKIKRNFYNDSEYGVQTLQLFECVLHQAIPYAREQNTTWPCRLCFIIPHIGAYALLLLGLTERAAAKQMQLYALSCLLVGYTVNTVTSDPCSHSLAVSKTLARSVAPTIQRLARLARDAKYQNQLNVLGQASPPIFQTRSADGGTRKLRLLRLA